jgi:hypothetical protein
MNAPARTARPTTPNVTPTGIPTVEVDLLSVPGAVLGVGVEVEADVGVEVDGTAEVVGFGGGDLSNRLRKLYSGQHVMIFAKLKTHVSIT